MRISADRRSDIDNLVFCANPRSKLGVGRGGEVRGGDDLTVFTCIDLILP